MVHAERSSLLLVTFLAITPLLDVGTPSAIPKEVSQAHIHISYIILPASARTAYRLQQWSQLQSAIVLLICALLASGVAGKVVKDVTSLQIGVKHRPKECAVKTKTGDSVSMHYTGEHLREHWVARPCLLLYLSLHQGALAARPLVKYCSV